MELRIGDFDARGSGNARLKANPLVADIGTGTEDPNHVFELAKPVGGRFLTLQTKEGHRNYLEVDELNVNVEV